MDAKIILMADNQSDFLEERREFLENAGYTVVTTNNPADTRNVLMRGGVDLAILDLRLIDDDDQEDTSGLELAREFGQNLPIIILTGYPTWEAVKASLKKSLNGLSPVVDFLSKDEGPDVMVQAVDMTINHPHLKRNILQEFQVEATQDLYDEMKRKDLGDTTDKFQKSLDQTESELQHHRAEISRQAANHQKTARWMGMIGMGVLVVGAVFVYYNLISVAILSGIAGVIFEAVSVLFFGRADRASQKVDQIFGELQEFYKESQLILMCDTIETKSKREEAKLLIIQRLTGKRIG